MAESQLPDHITSFEACTNIAGVELGGTKCICVLVDVDRRIIDQLSIPTASPEATLGTIEATLATWWQNHGFGALGIASFGPVDLDRNSATYGFITSTPKPGWRQTNVVKRLSGPYPIPVAFDTDVNGGGRALKDARARRTALKTMPI